MDHSPWNSLEIAKLCASLLTPAAVAIFGIYANRVTKRFENLQWRSQKLIEKRLAVYDELTPQLNDLLCYFTYVGCWRDLDPPAVVALKRVIDKKIYLAAPLFSKEFFTACMSFQELCFETYTGWGHDASLRTQMQRRRESRQNWNDDWNTYFSDNFSDPKAVRAAYTQMMEAFARDIGVNSSFVIPTTGGIPFNIK